MIRPADLPANRTTEQVIVVPTAVLRARGGAPGFDPDPRRFAEVAFAPGAARAMPRPLAEVDPRYKQLVAYVILRCEGRIFHYQRSARAGESRLAGRRSLGVGGHLNADDWIAGASWEALTRGLRRELDEEVELPGQPTVRYVGEIDDDDEPVSRVHLGIVALADLEVPRVALRDPTLQDGRFDSLQAVRVRQGEFEGWSRLCLPFLGGVLGGER